MKRLAIVVLAAAAAASTAGRAAQPAAAEKPRVTRAALASLEREFDQKIQRRDISDPFDMLGSTRGLYLPGYGVVFTSEVNLVLSPFTPFHPAPTAASLEQLHQKKILRLAALKSIMREMLVASAGALESVPPDEQIVLGITLFYRSFENRDGLPSQVAIEASRQALLDFKAGRISSAQLDAAIRTQEL